MNLASTTRIAFRALIVHKGRSVLTSLGIVIGVSAVIAMVAAGDGVQRKLDERMATVGSNLVLIRAGARTKAGAVADSIFFSHDDATALRKEVGSFFKGLAEVQLTQREVVYKSKHWRTLLCGTTPDLAIIREWKLTLGRFVTAEDVTQAASVCVIAHTARKELFASDAEAMGQNVRIDNVQLRVVGTLAPKGSNPVGADQDDEIFVPLTTLQRKIVGEDRVNTMIAGIKSEALTDTAIEQIERVLRRTHKLKEGNSDFDVSSVREMAELGYTITSTIQLLSAVIASLSLLVGGIGIMNIMLVSVTERTREIGLRMAVGARGADILAQFLIEAVLLSLLGGVIGVTIGVGVAIALASTAGWPVVISPWVVVLACGVSATVGVFFGFYPAWKASRLDPIDALRYE